MFFQLEQFSGASSKRNVFNQQEDQKNALSRHHSYKEFKTSLSTLSFGGDSLSGEKRHSLRSNSSVMGKIKDRTGIPV